jgi:tetratricopeptide (TPR) repeat protein
MLLRIGLVVAILLAYSPLFTADFTVWDDTYNVAENARLSPPTWQSVGHYWTHFAYDLYIPVTYTVWAAIARLAYVQTPDGSGSHLNPYLFHTANVVVHIGSTLLVFEILRKLLRAPWPRGNAPAGPPPWAAAIGALVFAVHPIQVETVGWVAGMKDLLAGFFSFLAIWLYLPNEPGDPKSEISVPRFAVATVAVTLAMLSKPIAVVTPLMALAIDLLLLKRFRPRLLVWFIPAAACAVAAKLAQPAAYPQLNLPFWAHPPIAGDSIAFYLLKLVWPLKLGVDYGRTPQETLASHWPYLTALIPLLIAVVLWVKWRRIPFVATGAVLFVLGMLPVSGIVRFDFQIYSTVADHYLYLPMLGVAIIVAAIARRKALRPILAIILVLFSVQTFLQARTWKDSVTLFSHALEVNPRSWMSHDNVAAGYLLLERPEDAKPHCLAALALKPDVALTYDKLGMCLHLEGKNADAIEAYRTATRLDPSDSQAWAALGDLLLNAGDRKGAIDAYEHGIRADPNAADLLVNLASTLAEDGQLDRAIELYKSALKINPNSPEALEGLARATTEQHKRKSPTDRQK